jgi:hypothetical protein
MHGSTALAKHTTTPIMYISGCYPAVRDTVVPLDAHIVVHQYHRQQTRQHECGHDLPRCVEETTLVLRMGSENHVEEDRIGGPA